MLTLDVSRVVIGGGVSRLGPPLLREVRDALDGQAEGSPLLACLRLAARVELVPVGTAVAAIRAALPSRSALRTERTRLTSTPVV